MDVSLSFSKVAVCVLILCLKDFSFEGTHIINTSELEQSCLPMYLFRCLKSFEGRLQFSESLEGEFSRLLISDQECVSLMSRLCLHVPLISVFQSVMTCSGVTPVTCGG